MGLQVLGTHAILGDDLDVTVAPLGPLGPVVSSVTPHPTPWWVWAALLYLLTKKRRR